MQRVVCTDQLSIERMIPFHIPVNLVLEEVHGILERESCNWCVLFIILDFQEPEQKVSSSFNTLRSLRLLLCM